MKKAKFRYSNYINATDIKEYIKGNPSRRVSNKFNDVLPFFNYESSNLISFIEANKDCKSHSTTIHKSKGLEYDTCVIVNNFSPEIVTHNKLDQVFTPEQIKFISFDPEDPDDFEENNIHYVAISRAKHKLYFMAINM